MRKYYCDKCGKEMVKSKEKEKVDILNILVELSSSNDIKYCTNFILKKGDEIKISVMKVDEKNE